MSDAKLSDVARGLDGVLPDGSPFRLSSAEATPPNPQGRLVLYIWIDARPIAKLALPFIRLRVVATLDAEGKIGRPRITNCVAMEASAKSSRKRREMDEPAKAAQPLAQQVIAALSNDHLPMYEAITQSLLSHATALGLELAEREKAEATNGKGTGRASAEYLRPSHARALEVAAVFVRRRDMLAASDPVETEQAMQVISQAAFEAAERRRERDEKERKLRSQTERRERLLENETAVLDLLRRVMSGGPNIDLDLRADARELLEAIENGEVRDAAA